jgi:hypothetical protein
VQHGSVQLQVACAPSLALGPLATSGTYSLARTGTLAALDTNTPNSNITGISLQQVYNRGIYPPFFPFATLSSVPCLVRSIGDRINSPPGPRRVPNVKKALAEFEHAGVLTRDGNHYRLTPHLQSVYVPLPLALALSDVPSSLDEARVRYKVPINSAPRRQMRALVSRRACRTRTCAPHPHLATELYRKVLSELSEREDVDLEGLTPEKIASLSRSKASYNHAVPSRDAFSRVILDARPSQAGCSAVEASQKASIAVYLCTPPCTSIRLRNGHRHRFRHVRRVRKRQ